jgi:hypothetical protein
VLAISRVQRRHTPRLPLSAMRQTHQKGRTQTGLVDGFQTALGASGVYYDTQVRGRQCGSPVHDELLSRQRRHTALLNVWLSSSTARMASATEPSELIGCVPSGLDAFELENRSVAGPETGRPNCSVSPGFRGLSRVT